MAGVIRTLVNPPKGYKAPKPTPKPTTAADLSIPPDYNAILTTDPRYTSGEAALTSVYDPNNPHAGSAAASRAAQIRAALIRYGYSGQDLGNQYGDITPEDYAAASGNTQGIFQQLLRAYKKNLQEGKNSLEARGILNSGAATADENIQNNAYQGEYANNLENLRSLISGAIGGYVGAGNEYRTGHAQLVNQIATQLKNDPTITSTTAHLVPNSQAYWGKPVYSDAAGKLYTADGKPFTPPSSLVSPYIRSVSNPGGVL